MPDWTELLLVGIGGFGLGMACATWQWKLHTEKLAHHFDKLTEHSDRLTQEIRHLAEIMNRQRV